MSTLTIENKTPARTPAALIARDARRELDGKSKVLAEHRKYLAAAIAASDAEKVHKTEIIIRRLEKSVANRMAKVLCSHSNVHTQKMTRHGVMYTYHQCLICKASHTRR